VSRPLFLVDAFATEPFRGNPAAVCVLDAPRDASWMLAVAAEMNLSETAFVVVDGGGDELPLRWFTPKVEVDLCGLATLATAHVLWETGRVDAAKPARFATASGVLECRVADDGTIWMDLPALASDEIDEPPGLAAALGAAPVRPTAHSDRGGRRASAAASSSAIRCRRAAASCA
jgi:PhzF family phenazine biosynthesis protein